MRNKFICLSCEHEFDEPAVHEESHGLDTLPFETIYVCPNCGSSWCAPAVYCDLCEHVILDKYIQTVDGVNICDECYVGKWVDDY